MGEEMDVDGGALAAVVKDEASGGGEPTEPSALTIDKVSLLQESVDKMALSMFNALRLLPANVGDESSKEETATAVRTFACFGSSMAGLSLCMCSDKVSDGCG